MSDLSSDRIRELLSDPKNIELIAGLASGMSAMGSIGGIAGAKQGAGTGTSEHAGLSETFRENKSIPAADAFAADGASHSAQDIPAFADTASNPTAPSDPLPEKALPALPAMSGNALSGMLSSGGGGRGQDKRIALLKAIKPYVNDAKKERVDGLVRAISVAGMLSNYKNGLFG